MSLLHPDPETFSKAEPSRGGRSDGEDCDELPSTCPVRRTTESARSFDGSGSKLDEELAARGKAERELHREPRMSRVSSSAPSRAFPPHPRTTGLTGFGDACRPTSPTDLLLEAAIVYGNNTTKKGPSPSI